LWPLDMHTGGLVGEYSCAPGPLQSGQLQVRVLVLGGDATVADVHAPYFDLDF